MVTNSTGNIAGEIPQTEFEAMDVWSRTARRYRIRSTLMLLLLGGLFAGSCLFTFWLRTGELTPWNSSDYREILAKSFTPWTSDQITLNDFLTKPIPVAEVPIHAVIMGLQFASLCSIPILVAILYRLPASVPFCAMIVLFAAMPWFGITVQIGCVLACIGPFRFKFRFASALIGLLPIAIYFIVASWEPADAPFRAMQDQAMLYAPWVLALLASCVISAAALAIARLIDYRPGGIPPVLATLFAIPVILFHTHVGRHELEYRLLESEIGPANSALFVPVDLGRRAGALTLEQWNQHPERDYESLFAETLEEETERTLAIAESDRQRAIYRCNRFIETFPTSRHVPTVLFLKGRALDMRVDEVRLAQDHRIEFRSDRPNAASRETWKAIVDAFPTNDVAATAMHRMAMLEAMNGNLELAISTFESLISRFDPSAAATQPASNSRGPASVVAAVFERTDTSETLGIRIDAITESARKLHELLLAAKGDDSLPISTVFGPRDDGSDTLVAPAQLLMTFDPSHPAFADNLEGLIRAFPNASATDFARVRLALLDRAVSRRIQRLRDACKQLENRPAGAEAAFYLGDSLQEDHLLAEALRTFEQLAAAYPRSSWAGDARERMAALTILMQTPS